MRAASMTKNRAHDAENRRKIELMQQRVINYTLYFEST